MPGGQSNVPRQRSGFVDSATRFHEHGSEILRAALGESKWERLSCGCPVEMGVYNVEDALAQTIRTNALARTTGMQDEKTT